MTSVATHIPGKYDYRTNLIILFAATIERVWWNQEGKGKLKRGRLNSLGRTPFLATDVMVADFGDRASTFKVAVVFDTVCLVFASFAPRA
jgi:hypothetical protein